jgi:hypothetical protein
MPSIIPIKIAAMHHSYQAFERAEIEMKFNGDLSLLKARVYLQTIIKKYCF